MHGRTWLGVVLALAMGTGLAAAKERTCEVSVTAPDSAWRLSIEAVYQVKGELWVISRVSRDPDAMGAQVITTLKASVKIEAPELPVKHFVIGKTWNWEGDEPCTYLDDLKVIQKDLQSAKVIYKKGP
jgi:zinc protease